MTRAVRHLALTWSALATCAGAAPHDPWVRIQSAGFELFTTAGERAGRDLVEHFEKVRAFFSQAFELTASKPVRIFAFRNEKEFAPYRPNEVAAAFYHPDTVHDFIVMSGTSAELYQVATHEYTHLLIGQTGTEIPVWLNEGMAELYATLEPAEGRILVGKVPSGRAETLRSEPWIDLGLLLSATRESPLYNQKAHASVFYAESWALFHMLFLNRQYRPQLRAMLDALQTGDTAAAFQKAYGKSVAQVEQDLHAYVRSPYLTALSLDVQLPKSSGPPTIQAAAAFPAGLALAELLAGYPAHQQQARASYEQLARQYPDRWEVESDWGRFCLRERRNEEALQHLTQATASGAADASTFVELARALSLAHRQDDAAAALRTALTLDPKSQAAHFDLGLLKVRASDWREALAELQAAAPVSRQQASRYFYSLAYCEYRLGDLVQARAYAALARPYTHIAEEQAALDKLAEILGPPVVEGVLESVECQNGATRLHVRLQNLEKVFLTPDLNDVHGLECGAHPAVPVRITYQYLPPGPASADGLVRALEFR